MRENKYTEFIRNHRKEADELKKKVNMALSDDDMAKATGGLGGANEATCPKCGKPMAVVNNNYGDNYWTCKACDIDQFMSDADYIEMLKLIESSGQTEGVVYPVWWNKIK